MKSNNTILVFISLAIVLSGYLFIPVSGDLSIYALGGKTIAEGGRIYYDYVDIKPPLFYMVFALIYKTIGISHFALRGFDYVMQLATAFLLYLFIRRKFGDQLFAYLSSLVYIISFMTLQMFHTENFVAPAIILIMILIFNKRRNYMNYLAIGALAAFLAGLKYTLGVVLVGIIIYDYINKESWKDFTFKLSAYLISSIFILLISFIPLLNPESMMGYKDILRFTAFYANIPHLDLAFIKFTITRLGIFFGDNYSICFVVLFSFGLARYFKLFNNNDDNNKIFTFILIQLPLLLLSIIIERKYVVYSFMRLYIFLSIFVGFGLAYFVNIIYKDWRSWTTFKKLISICMILFSLLLSPVTRAMALYNISFDYLTDRNKYIDYYQRTAASSTILLRDYIDISNLINKEANNDDMVLVMATGGNMINYYTQQLRHSRFAHSLFYFTPFDVPDWRHWSREELAGADWIVLQTNDRHEIVTGTPLSSMESVRADSSMNNYLNENFFEYRQIDSFYIYKRK